MSKANPITTEHRVTAADLEGMLPDAEGVDLELVRNGDRCVGMRVIGVRADSTAARLGGRDGDIIESINDVPLITATTGYRVAAEAVREGRFVIRGTRDGVPFVTTLAIATD